MKFLLSTGIGYKTHTLQELEALALAEGYDGLELNMPPRHVSPEETIRDVGMKGCPLFTRFMRLGMCMTHNVLKVR